MTSAFAVLDIHRRADGALPEEVIRLAYKASRRVRIVLLLDCVSAAEVDRLLDPLVKQCRLDIPGLIYLQSHHPPSELDLQSDFVYPAENQGVLIHRTPAPGSAAEVALLDRLARATRCDEVTVL